MRSGSTMLDALGAKSAYGVVMSFLEKMDSNCEVECRVSKTSATIRKVITQSYYGPNE